MEQHALGTIASEPLSSHYLIEKKFEVMLNAASKNLLGEILKIKEALSLMQEDINKLKAGYANDSGSENTQQAIAASSGNTESKAIRPGYDGINPKDVAVEKMFYFGKKR